MKTEISAYPDRTRDQETRIVYWDALKGLLIFLVVFAHFLYPFRGKIPIKYIVDIIYFFHMPAFIFISGYFSKKENSSSFRSIAKLILLYLLMNTPFVIYKAIRYQQFQWVTPYYSSWYLLALIIWRVGIQFLRKIKIQPWRIIFGSIVIALLAGFWNDINNVLSISRTIAFLPFFLLGYYLPASLANNYLIHKKSSSVMTGIILLGFSALVAFLISDQANISSSLLMDSYSSMGYLWIRCCIVTLAFLFTISLMLIMPVKVPGFTFLERWGRNSLWVFVLHRPITLLFPKIFHATQPYLILIAFILSLFTVFLLSLDFTSRFFNRMLNSFFCGEYRIRTACTSILLVALIVSLPVWFLIKNTPIAEPPEKADILYPVMYEFQKEAFDQAISIAFVGDLIMLQDQVRSGYNKTDGLYKYSAMFEHTTRYLSKADYAIGVYESPSAGEEAGYTTGNYDDGIPLHINLPDSFASAVKASGIDLVTTANNHLLDKDTDGAFRTLDILDKAGLDHTGSYRNKAEKKSKIIQIKGLKVGILSYTFGVNYYSEDYFLQEENSFITSVLVDESSKYFESVKASVIRDFEQLKTLQPDIIIVLPHMGTQFSHTTDSYQELWNSVFLENGADIIFGDHAHAVQPIEIRKVPEYDYKKALIVNYPGNYANSYTSFDGDISAIVNAYIDPISHEVLGASINPLWVQGKADNSYRALPIYDIAENTIIQKQLGKIEIQRVEEACKIASSVMLGVELTTDQLQKYNYLTPEGYQRTKVPSLAISDELQKSRFYQWLNEADRVCFIGDFITEGTKNGGFGWFEPLAEATTAKRYFYYAWGGATTVDLLHHTKEITSQKADLFVIAIGTNDIRYRDPTICAMDSSQYIQNLVTLINSIQIHFPEARFAFISPWLAMENDKVSRLSVLERDKFMQEYGKALAEFCKENEFLYIDPNPLIKAVLTKEAPSRYLLDYIHPNVKNGIYLYSLMVLEASK